MIVEGCASQLTEVEKEQFLQLLLEYADIFAKEGELGRTDKIKHNIDTSMLDQSDSPSAGCLCARGES